MTGRELKRLADKLKTKQLSKEDSSLVEQLFFFEKALPSSVDVVFVLAGEKLNRIAKGVEMVKKVGGLLLISGGNKEKGEEEWKRYASYALSHGIREENLLLEKKSTNTYQNIKYSLSILPHRPLSILFVSSRPHLLRVSLTLKKVLQEENLSIFPSFVASVSQDICWENWSASSSTKMAFSKELEKIVTYHLDSYLS